ncbi:hypothetical protein Ancab_025974, partial [Ancistrocladus abbreviatus]
MLPRQLGVGVTSDGDLTITAATTEWHICKIPIDQASNASGNLKTEDLPSLNCDSRSEQPFDGLPSVGWPECGQVGAAQTLD